MIDSYPLIKAEIYGKGNKIKKEREYEFDVKRRQAGGLPCAEEKKDWLIEAKGKERMKSWCVYVFCYYYYLWRLCSNCHEPHTNVIIRPGPNPILFFKLEPTNMAVPLFEPYFNSLTKTLTFVFVPQINFGPSFIFNKSSLGGSELGMSRNDIPYR